MLYYHYFYHECNKEINFMVMMMKMMTMIVTTTTVLMMMTMIMMIATKTTTMMMVMTLMLMMVIICNLLWITDWCAYCTYAKHWTYDTNVTDKTSARTAYCNHNWSQWRMATNFVSEPTFQRNNFFKNLNLWVTLPQQSSCSDVYRQHTGFHTFHRLCFSITT